MKTIFRFFADPLLGFWFLISVLGIATILFPGWNLSTTQKLISLAIVIGAAFLVAYFCKRRS